MGAKLKTDFTVNSVLLSMLRVGDWVTWGSHHIAYQVSAINGVFVNISREKCFYLKSHDHRGPIETSASLGPLCWDMSVAQPQNLGEVIFKDGLSPKQHPEYPPCGDAAPTPKVDDKVRSNGGPTSYYFLPKWATELGHLISFKRMNFNIGNIFKAAYRLGEKEGNDLRYDLNKIIFFANAELEELDRKEGKLK